VTLIFLQLTTVDPSFVFSSQLPIQMGITVVTNGILLHAVDQYDPSCLHSSPQWHPILCSWLLMFLHQFPVVNWVLGWVSQLSPWPWVDHCDRSGVHSSHLCILICVTVVSSGVQFSAVDHSEYLGPKVVNCISGWVYSSHQYHWFPSSWPLWILHRASVVNCLSSWVSQ